MLKLKNVYGYPAATPEIVDYAKKQKLSLVYGITNLAKGNAIVIDGLTLLLNLKFPVLGYQMTHQGVLRKDRLPEILESNVVKFKPVITKFPNSKQLQNYYHKNEIDPAIEPGRWLSYTKLPPKKIYL